MSRNNPQSHRWLIVKYAILTLIIVLPLLWVFRKVINVYPVSAWNVMMSGGDLNRGWPYYILTGETISGEKVDVRPAHLTNALYNRSWGLVNATVENRNFKLDTLHPSNADLMTQLGGFQNLPPGTRLPELLQAWGKIYNDKLPASSPKRLKAIQIDMYRWDSGRYADYGTHLKTWRKDL